MKLEPNKKYTRKLRKRNQTDDFASMLIDSLGVSQMIRFEDKRRLIK